MLTQWATCSAMAFIFAVVDAVFDSTDSFFKRLNIVFIFPVVTKPNLLLRLAGAKVMRGQQAESFDAYPFGDLLH